MREMLQNHPKLLKIAAAVLALLLSVFVVSGPVSSVNFHKDTLEALDQKQTTVLELSAATTAASALITLVPGDVATPIADELAELSSHFVVVLCAIFLEKYLVTITGTVAFSALIPAACVLYILYLLLGNQTLKTLAAKLAVFGLLIVLVIPVSVRITNCIEDTYHESIQAAIDDAKQIAQDIPAEGETEQTEEPQDQGFWSGLVSGVTNGVSNAVSGVTGAVSGVADTVKEKVNRIIEALAVMIITCCVIPVLVLLSFVWLAKAILAVDLSVSYTGVQKMARGGIDRARESCAAKK